MKARVLAAVLFGAVTSLFLFVGAVGATGFKSGDQISVPAGETIDGSFYGAGSDITVAGTVKGDVVCAGQSVTISGVIDGDVVCAAQTVKVAGKVKGDVRVAAQTVTLESQVAQNATVFAQTLYTTSNSKIGGDLGGGVQNADLSGQIGRDVTLAGQIVKFAGTVGRDVDVMVEQASLATSAAVKGDFAYQSKREANIADGASVAGEVQRSNLPTTDVRDDKFDFRGFGVGAAWYLFFASLIVGLAVVLVLPRPIHDVSSQAVKKPVKVALTGLAVSFLMPIMILAIIFTIVGLPLALFVGLVWLTVVATSGPLFAYFIGRLILRKYATQPVLTMLVGVVAVFLLYLIPFINILTMLASLWFGTGMLLVQLAKYYKKPEYTVKV